MWLAGKKIAPTESTPKVVLDPAGAITIRGRSLNKNSEDVFQQIDSWLDVYLHNPAETTNVELYFEYFNSNNSTIFNALLKKISRLQLNNKKVVINWYYEEDDEDILSLGENISLVLHIPMNLIMIPEG
jgi:hypothetical protein